MSTFLKLTLFVFLMAFFQSCIPFGGGNDDFDVPETNQDYEPLVMLRNEFENSTALLPPRPIINSGKIYVKAHFLFIGESNEGFHIFDNSNPTSPVNIAFLKVLGTSDMSIKGETLFFNNATDLIAVTADFTSNTLEITKRISYAFPQIEAPDSSYYNPQSDEIIIGWNLIQ